MKTLNGKMKIKALALAVQGVLFAMAAMLAHADDEEAAALKKPTSTIEFGGLDVTHDSAKFGEYTGYNKNGAYFLGNFSVLSGRGDSDDTKRWAIIGSDLGTTSRALGATISDQGRWTLGIGHSELTHVTSDSYQTPYQGSLGGAYFVLPTNFTSVSTAAPGTRSLTATQLGDFQTMEISNTRTNNSLSAGFNASKQWEVKVDYNRREQSGAKLMGFGSYGSAAIGGTGTNEKVAILPMPTNYTTDDVNVALNWLGDKGHATGSYYGSFFHDNWNGVKFQTFEGIQNTQTMGTAPSNNFQQLNLNGGYAFTSRTKFAGGLSYGRNTQNTAYAYDTFAMVTPSPTASLGGFVGTTHADMKLTDQTTRDLALSAGYKYDDRANRTDSNIYNFNAISGGNTANYPNTPLSIKKTQLELAGDYRLSRTQQVRLAYNQDHTHRECKDYAVGGNIVGGAPNYQAGTNCVTATETKERKIGATYRYKASGDVNLNAGYIYSNRESTYDGTARASIIGANGNPSLVSGTQYLGINAGDFQGFHPYFEASRIEQVIKAGANWQATEKLSLVASARYLKDDYEYSTYGVQKGRGLGLNFDTTYAYREEGSITFFASQLNRTRDLTDIQRSPTSAQSNSTSATSLTLPSGATWTNKLQDTETVLGLNLKQGGLMGGKVDIAGDITYTLGKSHQDTTLNYNTTSNSGALCSDPTIMSCGYLPDIRSMSLQYRLMGDYKLGKNSKVNLGYLYRRLDVNDYYYNGLQYGYTPTSVLPTNQTAPNYRVNMVWASYVYSFK